MNVIEEEEIAAEIAGAEVGDGLGFERVGETAGKIGRGDGDDVLEIQRLATERGEGVGDAGLADPRGPVEDERVVRERSRLRCFGENADERVFVAGEESRGIADAAERGRWRVIEMGDGQREEATGQGESAPRQASVGGEKSR